MVVERFVFGEKNGLDIILNGNVMFFFCYVCYLFIFVDIVLLNFFVIEIYCFSIRGSFWIEKNGLERSLVEDGGWRGSE